MDLNESSQWLCQQIRNKRGGFAAGKIGSAELGTIIVYLQRKKIYMPYSVKLRKEITVNAGLWEYGKFSLDEVMDMYAEEMIKSLKVFDAISPWIPFMKDEESLIHKYCCPDPCVKIHSRAFEPFYTPENMYSREMIQGPIAVVSPFAKTISRQLEKRRLLFPVPLWLESQEIIPIQGYYGPYLDSGKGCYSKEILEKGPFIAMDLLAEEVIKSGAKYCLVGIGGLSLLLVSRLKKAGIIAIHTGGGTQIIFGVRGNRWQTHNVISKFFNDNWAFPSKEEVPTNANNVERACYW
jgi:hypothetical protein